MNSFSIRHLLSAIRIPYWQRKKVSGSIGVIRLEILVVESTGFLNLMTNKKN